MSLELKNGYLVLLIDYGTGTRKIEQKQIRISDGESHRIEIIWTKTVCTHRVIYFLYYIHNLNLFSEHRN